MAERYEYYNTPHDGFASIYNFWWEAQTFTPIQAHRITKAYLLLSRYGLPGTVTLSVRATNGSGHPTGPDLCYGSFDGNTLPGSMPGDWPEITLGMGAELNAAIKYAIVLRAPGGNTSNLIRWRRHSAGTYPRGWQEYSTNHGSSWTGQSWSDFMFEEWGQALGPTIETQDATNIKSTDATLHTKVLDDMGKTLSVRHNYGKTTAYGMNTPWQEGKHTDDVISQPVPNLDPETEYHFRGEGIYED